VNERIEGLEIQIRLLKNKINIGNQKMASTINVSSICGSEDYFVDIKT